MRLAARRQTLATDALKTVRGLRGVPGGGPLVRADSAFYGRGLVLAAVRAGAEVSVTVRLDKRVKAAIAAITDDAWTPIQYTDAIWDEATRRWISRAEVAEVPFTAFASRSKAERVPGRLVVRRIPDLNTAKNKASGQDALFDVWRFHAFFTTVDPDVMDTVAVDKTHRGHAIIEQVNADLKNSAPRPPALRRVRRERRLARARGDGVQPHPRRHHPCRRRTGQSHHRHDPPQTDQHRCPDRLIREANHPAPTARLALATPLDRTVQPRLRTTSHRHALTTPAQPEQPHVEPTRSEEGHPTTPTRPATHPTRISPSRPADRWIEAVAERVDAAVADTAESDPAHDSEHPPVPETEHLALAGAGQAQPGADSAMLSADGVVDGRATALHSRLARDHEARSRRVAPCSITLQIFRC